MLSQRHRRRGLVRTNNMNPVCESHYPPETRNRRATKGNCVAVRRGGEHACSGTAALKAPVELELDSAFQREEPASPWRTLRASAIMHGNKACQNADAWTLWGGWSKDAGKGSWDNVESPGRRRCASTGPGSQSAHSSCEAGNAVEPRSAGR
jgi:hypothetical protein